MFDVGKPLPHAAAPAATSPTRRCGSASARVRPGTRLGDIGATIQRFVEANHYSVVREYCGHGIGRGFHEDPQVLHYGTRRHGPRARGRA